MYNYIVNLLDGEQLIFKNIFISREVMLSSLNESNSYLKIEEYIIPKTEIKYIKYLDHSEANTKGENK